MALWLIVCSSPDRSGFKSEQETLCCVLGQDT